MLKIIKPDIPDAVTCSVSEHDIYATLTHGDESLTLPVINAPFSNTIVVFLTTDGKLRFIPDSHDPVIAAVFNYMPTEIILTLFQLPGA